MTRSSSRPGSQLPPSSYARFAFHQQHPSSPEHTASAWAEVSQARICPQCTSNPVGLRSLKIRDRTGVVFYYSFVTQHSQNRCMKNQFFARLNRKHRTNLVLY